MRRDTARVLLLLLLPALVIRPVGAHQGGASRRPPPDPPGAREPLPPIPPGVPTTAENVHLPTEGEVKLGREGAAQVEKIYRVIRSGPQHDRLQRVAREVVRAFNRPEIIAEYRRVYRLPKKDDRSRRVPFEYSFRVVDEEKEVNAFSLAGGPIYVTRGLLDYATSDHELAAVLAHECAHVAFHHVEQLVRRQRKVNTAQMWGLLATIIAGAAGGGAAAGAASNVLIGSQLVSIAMTTGYGRELEHEADRIGVMALRYTPYEPLAMYTFMQKLARDDRLRGNPDGGIFQSHPYANERVVAIRKQLLALGVNVDAGAQRQVADTFRVEVLGPGPDTGGYPAVQLNGRLVLLVAAAEGDLGPAARAEQIARRLEQLFRDNVSLNDVRLSADKRTLWMKGVAVLQVLPEDGRAAGGEAAAGERAYKSVIQALWEERLRFGS